MVRYYFGTYNSSYDDFWMPLVKMTCWSSQGKMICLLLQHMPMTDDLMINKLILQVIESIPLLWLYATLNWVWYKYLFGIDNIFIVIMFILQCISHMFILQCILYMYWKNTNRYCSDLYIQQESEIDFWIILVFMNFCCSDIQYHL